MLTDQNNQTIPAVPVGMKKAQQNVAGSMGDNPGAPGPQVKPEEKENSLKKPKKKLNLKLIIGAIILVLLLIGGGAGLYLSQIDQDVRQQASTDGYCNAGEIFCGGCIDGCKPATKTCNTWIDESCQGTNPDGSSCAGNGAFPASGQSCCEGLTTHTNGRCWDDGTGTGPVTPQPSASPSDLVIDYGECVDGVCNSSGDGCIAIHHCDELSSEGHCTVQSPNVVSGTVNAQEEANNSCRCVQVDVLNGGNGSCENGHINGDPSTLIGAAVVCPNIDCQAPDPTTIVQNSPDPTDDSTDNPTDDPTDDPTEEPTPTPLAQCNEGCSVDTDCAETNHSCIDSFCRLTTNPESVTCDEATPVGCNDPCQVSTDCAEANHACLESPDDGNPDGGVCRLIANPTSTTCVEPTPSPSPTPTVGCNDACVTDADCSDSDHSCNDETNSCRLTENPGDENCAPVVPSPTPAPGCNEECYASSDCTNTSAVCYDNLCRLSTNPTNTSCQAKEVVQQTGNYYEQPDLPQTLPESGSEDILNWLKVGLGALGLGLIFLFL